jgi:hypothetical protein
VKPFASLPKFLALFFIDLFLGYFWTTFNRFKEISLNYLNNCLQRRESWIDYIFSLTLFGEPLSRA